MVFSHWTKALLHIQEKNNLTSPQNTNDINTRMPWPNMSQLLTLKKVDQVSGSIHFRNPDKCFITKKLWNV